MGLKTAFYFKVLYFLAIQPIPSAFANVVIHAGDKLTIAIIDLGRHSLPGGQQLFFRLGPAGMRNFRIHIGPEPVFTALQFFPIADRALIGEGEADNRLD